ncbi:Putative zn(2)Cys(6) fungal-type DNA-binding domain, fungal transcription factor [Colletotrichum destructivum]|uniref:Zn(2)Cys(6) fungal-type DNA-binding domain, fungal transcription factor n=1 Tax=Colletotrichum destructivum TaxID=34406 RepID=A0AAX4J3J2_9PEZI|nr:Putative zn(2)Cys(6) fungal-type DNA-binding domain, fungal transcription factor [Colletotrichum destructivum]
MTSTSTRLALAMRASSQTTIGGGGSGRRQCWECQRRRLVCDSARPVCSKCKISGVVCPGYEDKKPLTWLAPNKVKTRTWKRKGGATAAGGDAVSKSQAGSQEKDDVLRLAASAKQLVHIFPGQELRSETCDIIEATLYWNEQVYPSFTSNQLAQSPWIIPVIYVHYMKPCIQHALVAMAIEHRMMRMSQRTNDPFVAEVRARACQHRSTAVQALNRDIALEQMCSSDFTLSSVIVFLYGDQLMGSATASNWRFHIKGFTALIALRGGWESVCQKTPHLKVLVLFCKIVENFANTTSPADDQMSPVSNFELRDLCEDVFGTGYYPFLPCPAELFIDIIRVNRLRFLATRQPDDDDDDDQDTAASIRSEAEELLTKITDFSPEAWSETKEDSKEGYLTMARVYQSAVVLFAISSLRSAGAVAPCSAGWTAVARIHRGRLFSLLETTAASPPLRSCTAWPIIVAGFEAKSVSPTARAFILNRLDEESRDLGVYLPLAARKVLERFYSSSGTRWDDCFDSPHALFT